MNLAFIGAFNARVLGVTKHLVLTEQHVQVGINITDRR